MVWRELCYNTEEPRPEEHTWKDGEETGQPQSGKDLASPAAAVGSEVAMTSGI